VRQGERGGGVTDDVGGDGDSRNDIHSANPNNDNRHVVSIEATTNIQFMNLTGVFATNFFGQKIIELWERLLIRIPVVKTIYGGVKQVSDTLLSGNGHAFRKVLLVRYPHPQAWSLAFQTNVPDEVTRVLPDEHVAVFIPTTPSPVNGFYFYVKKSEVIELNISVDRALKYIVSMGVASGEARPATQ
jgi:uncharacterized membrane protein